MTTVVIRILNSERTSVKRNMFLKNFEVKGQNLRPQKRFFLLAVLGNPKCSATQVALDKDRTQGLQVEYTFFENVNKARTLTISLKRLCSTRLQLGLGHTKTSKLAKQ